MERFKPDKLDDVLRKFFKPYGATYISPLDFCPIKGFQIIQEEEILKRSGTTTGFCQVWAFWYANMRMKYPDMSREKLIEKSLHELDKFPDKFTGFIIHYASFFEND